MSVHLLPEEGLVSKFADSGISLTTRRVIGPMRRGGQGAILLEDIVFCGLTTYERMGILAVGAIIAGFAGALFLLAELFGPPRQNNGMNYRMSAFLFVASFSLGGAYFNSGGAAITIRSANGEIENKLPHIKNQEAASSFVNEVQLSKVKLLTAKHKALSQT